ncbi:MAG TPA: hypothetical protein VEL76_31140 [Gemmataceae bacterium]|nr:hypothetical protein [Gemmataceae bacterium]
MRTSFRSSGLPFLTAGILVFAFTGTFHAQEGVGNGDRKPQDKMLRDALRTVINRGADLYNQNRDYLGCYRLYHGALLAVRPLLEQYPDLQAVIDAGVQKAEMVPVPWQRAFALREVLDRVRERLGGAPAVTDDKKGDDKGKTDKDKGKTDKKGAEKLPAPPRLSGKVTIKGEPLTSGYVTLIAADQQRFSASIRPDGTYTFRSASLKPGRYRVLVEESPGEKARQIIPQEFRDAATSSLMVELEKGTTIHDINIRVE